MRLMDQFEQSGAVLFRWRSYAPLFIAPVLMAALVESVGIEQLLGDAIDDTWKGICLFLSTAGLAIRWFVIGTAHPGTSGRNVKMQRAEVLNTTGAYSIVRNPLYLGNFIAMLGIALATMIWWFVLIVCLAYWLYIERIILAEEVFLSEKFGDSYLDWAGRTPVFIPNLGHWQAPARRFEIKSVLKREYNGLLAVATAFLVIESIMDLLLEGEPFRGWLMEDIVPVTFFGISAAAFLILRTLKKKTSFLG